MTGKVTRSLSTVIAALDKARRRAEDALAGVLSPVVTILRWLWVTRIALASLALGLVVTVAIEQWQDLYLDDRLDGLHLVTYVVVLVFAWTIPVHLSANWALEVASDTPGWGIDKQGLFRRALPVAYGLGTIAISLFGAFFAAATITDTNGRAAHAAAQRLCAIEQMSAVAVILFVAFLGWTAWISRRASKRRAHGETVARDWPETIEVALRYGVTSLSLLAFAVIVTWPLSVTDWLPGLILTPIMLGAWTPLATYLSILSTSKLHFPLIPALVIVVVVIGLFATTFHDVRLMAPLAGEVAKQPRQSDWTATIEHWKAANGCVMPEGKDKPQCRPLLIAAEGGASRSAYTAATFLGSLMDAQPLDGAIKPLRTKLFALSGVSGGALGVATFRAALQDSAEGKPAGKPPCKTEPESWRKCLQSLTEGDYLTPVATGLGFRDWFLPIAALFQPAGSEFPFADRAILLEQAMEQHYAEVTIGKGDICGKDAGKGLCRAFGHLDHAKAKDGTVPPWLPLLLLNSTAADLGRPVIVSDLPLAAVDETRANEAYNAHYPAAFDFFELGSACPGVRRAGDKPCEVDPQVEPGKDLYPQSRDIRLSTAIVTSARFPLMSPHGVVRNKAGTIAAALVDGGYYENSGLEALMPVYEALQKADLDPVILRIGNDPIRPLSPQPAAVTPQPPEASKAPVSENNCDSAQLDASEQTLPRPRDREAPPVLDQCESLLTRLGRQLSPIAALINARTGHTETLKIAVYEKLNPGLASGRGATPLTVGLMKPQVEGKYFRALLNETVVPFAKPELGCSPVSTHLDADGKTQLPDPSTLRRVSMSWWLSRVVRDHIDYQRCHTDNIDQLACTLHQAYGADGFKGYQCMVIQGSAEDHGRAGRELMLLRALPGLEK